MTEAGKLKKHLLKMARQSIPLHIRATMTPAQEKAAARKIADQAKARIRREHLAQK